MGKLHQVSRCTYHWTLGTLRLHQLKRQSHLISTPDHLVLQSSYWQRERASWRDRLSTVQVILSDMRFVKRFTRLDFQAKQIYTPKVCNSQLFLLTMQQCECTKISILGHFGGKI